MINMIQNAKDQVLALTNAAYEAAAADGKLPAGVEVRANVEMALSSSLGFGGHNGVLALRKCL